MRLIDLLIPETPEGLLVRVIIVTLLWKFIKFINKDKSNKES